MRAAARQGTERVQARTRGRAKKAGEDRTRIPSEVRQKNDSEWNVVEGSDEVLQ